MSLVTPGTSVRSAPRQAGTVDRGGRAWISRMPRWAIRPTSSFRPTPTQTVTPIAVYAEGTAIRRLRHAGPRSLVSRLKMAQIFFGSVLVQSHSTNITVNFPADVLNMEVSHVSRDRFSPAFY